VTDQYSPAPGPFKLGESGLRHLTQSFDGVEDMVHRDFEWSEVGSVSLGLHGVARGLFIDCAGSLILILLWEGRWRLQLLPVTALLGGAVGCATGRIFNLDVLLNLKEDVPHLGDFVLHQMLVKGVGDLQPTEEHCRRSVFNTVIYHSH